MSRKRPLSRKPRKLRLQDKLFRSAQTADLSPSAITRAIHEIVRLKQQTALLSPCPLVLD